MAEAQNNLGTLYHHGLGVKVDYAQALYWYKRAAEQGLLGAESNLGVMYQDGLGVSRDEHQAAKLYLLAARGGDSRGQFNLANLYAQGKGLSLDYVSAYYWYSIATDASDELSARALKRIGRLMTPAQCQQAEFRLSARRSEARQPLRPETLADEPPAISRP